MSWIPRMTPRRRQPKRKKKGKNLRYPEDKPPQLSENEDPIPNGGPTESRNEGHIESPQQVANPRPAENVDSPLDPPQQQAAFPSLPPGQSRSKNVQIPDVPGVTDLMLALEKGTEEDRKACHQRVDGMYALSAFPASLCKKQKEWYRKVSRTWGAEQPDEQIPFSSLYPSLILAIHNSIITAFPTGTYRSAWHPSLTILNISRADLLALITECSAVWDEIPQHLRELKRLNPGVAIDPDTPPRSAYLRAIRWLRQNHLPGCLLGEWQFPEPIVREGRTEALEDSEYEWKEEEVQGGETVDLDEPGDVRELFGEPWRHLLRPLERGGGGDKEEGKSGARHMRVDSGVLDGMQ